MKFIENNIGKDEKVLVKAHYDRIILAPFIALGALIALAGYEFKKKGSDLMGNYMSLSEINIPDSASALIGNVVFIIFLIAGIAYALFMIIRTTGIELAATDKLLIGRHGSDAMCVPLEKIENFVIFKNILGKIFKYGTITIGTPSTTMKFPYIADPEVFRDKVFELREKR